MAFGAALGACAESEVRIILLQHRYEICVPRIVAEFQLEEREDSGLALDDQHSSWA